MTSIDTNPTLLLPSSRAGFGNRLLNLIDALTQSSGLNAKIVTRDRELARIYNRTYSRPLETFRQPLLLSEALYRPGCIDPKDFFFHPKATEISHDVTAFHFRGRDFSAWKAHSIQKPEFFIQALEQAEEGHKFWMFTDDPEHKTVKTVEQFSKQYGKNLLTFRGSPYSDFSLLTRAGKIFASPSTFSLCAALFGAAKIVFSRDYANIEAKAGVGFWSHLIAGNQPAHITVELK